MPERESGRSSDTSRRQSRVVPRLARRARPDRTAEAAEGSRSDRDRAAAGSARAARTSGRAQGSLTRLDEVLDT